MIEINLLTGKKEGGLAAIGFDPSKINVKMLVVAFLVLWVPEPFLVEMWDSEIAKVAEKNSALKKEYFKYKKRVKSMQSIEEQVKALKEQERKLARKLEVVKEIINKRQNPFKVFFYLSNNIPKDVWLTEMELSDKTLTMTGYSRSWKSIGKFLENLKNSIFFDKNIQYEQPASEGNTDNQRIEAFTIVAKIARFE